MQEVNYVKHLNNVYIQFYDDDRLKSNHISLYLALFMLWNQNRFSRHFFINRGEVMRLSKIGSKNTYHKCLKELDKWKYIEYLPSKDPFKGAQMCLFDFSTI